MRFTPEQIEECAAFRQLRQSYQMNAAEFSIVTGIDISEILQIEHQKKICSSDTKQKLRAFIINWSGKDIKEAG